MIHLWLEMLWTLTLVMAFALRILLCVSHTISMVSDFTRIADITRHPML